MPATKKYERRGRKRRDDRPTVMDKAAAEAAGRRLKLLRIERGLTQEQLAGQAGVHAVTISRLEHGTLTDVSLDTLLRLGQVLGFTPDYYAGLQSERRPVSPSA
jgi:transcriptional regulator with XRE-family HTH domain